MILRHLRIFRIVISCLILILFVQMFVGIDAQWIHPIAYFFKHLQLFPSVIRFFVLFFSVSGLGFLLILFLTMLFGRVYCSSICPMGTLQDGIMRIASLFKKRKNKKFRYSDKKYKVLKYSILAGTLLLWISGSLFLVNLLDPYSNFGKISVSFFQPLYIWLNNTLSLLLETQGNYSVAPLAVKTLPGNVILVSSLILLTIATMASLRGRLFCNTICPAGTLLGLVAGKAKYQIAFKEETCTLCGRCERVCKAECIDSKAMKVDMARCVACYNCFSACKDQSLTYKPVSAASGEKEQQAANPGKRRFLLSFAAASLSIPLLKKFSVAQNTSRPGMIPTGTSNPVTPPGSLGYDHFTNNCVACYLCVSVCPTNVIVPSFFDYGLQGFMQPKLDFHKSFCNFDCVKCSEICPTGAIKQQNRESKQQIQIGVAKFMAESCIVMVDRTDCGACSEHCPTKAVHMVPFEDGLFIPEVNPHHCVGCGACEFACPTAPNKAIYVESNITHQLAEPIREGDGPKEAQLDAFPF